MDKSTIVLLAALLASSAIVAQAPAPANPPVSVDAPEPMTWAQLLERPELWPTQCKVTKAYGYAHDTLSLEATYPVLGLQGEQAVIGLPSGNSGTIPRTDTDVLAVANSELASMSPVQRALDLKTIVARADLWPAKVILRSTITAGEGADQKEFRAGSELTFGTFDGKWVCARHPDFDYMPRVGVHETDLVARVRAVLETKRPPAGHRVLNELDGKLFNLRTGKKARVNPKSPPEFVVLYFSASWCGPCQAFSPELVRFYEANKKDAGKRFEIIWISRDRTEREMQQYTKEHNFPWLAVAWDKLSSIPIAQAHDSRGIPDLVMLDATGALIADSYVGNEYMGAASVLEVLSKRLGKPR
ncbi:MAG: redoxin domain-containing protein [Planctomycetes bacterium]|nr:redoxin domain-containing protein [Planctomycetota bacterium]